jgi:N-acetylglucosamine-6-phosphate deacetylase
MSSTFISHATLVGLEFLAEDQAVVIESGKIAWCGPSSAIPSSGGFDETVDADGLYLAPGFIDLHIHGGLQYLIDRGPADLQGLCSELPRFGVTGFLPTICPLPPGDDAAFLKSLAETKTQGAQILAFHLEGPYLALTGALPKDALAQPDAARVRALQQAAQPRSLIFSIAPDVPGIENIIPLMAKNRTPVFMTHTHANVRQTQRAIDAGARHATHFYDVFPIPDVTDPGVRPCGSVEAILADPRVSVDFILDGVHVDPIAVKLALTCKSHDKVCLITDANIGAGMPPGRYDTFAGCEVEFLAPGQPARYTERSPYPGALAGSGLTLNLAVRNAMTMLGLSLPKAVRLAAANPAALLGLGRRKGQIRPGFDADLVLMTDQCDIHQTWIQGITQYKQT